VKIILAGILIALLTASIPQTESEIRVIIHTSKGDIEVSLMPSKAPVTVKNFLAYVDKGHYSNGRFHRTVTLQNQPDKKVKIEVIQAGVGPDFAKKDFKPIKLERTDITAIKHLNGTISMARNEPDTATSDFFICIGDQPELDYGGKRNPDGQGFGAFGQVTKGMDVVRAIQASPGKDQTLEPPISIISIERVK
jgi:peptidyl-prolyl cis-trans isomerase A (cyclophilin A)